MFFPHLSKNIFDYRSLFYRNLDVTTFGKPNIWTISKVASRLQCTQHKCENQNIKETKTNQKCIVIWGRRGLKLSDIWVKGCGLMTALPLCILINFKIH